jgi:hypothetical protein
MIEFPTTPEMAALEIETRRQSQARPRHAKGFGVAGWADRMGGFIAARPAWWTSLGALESKLAHSTLQQIEIDRPVYIAGLARSGTTILLESLARHPEVKTHRYRDFPFLFTPYLWNRWLDMVPRKAERPVERSHADGIAVTSESPEAFEEMLWMRFFPQLHDPASSAVLDGATENPAFETFYRDHIRKILAVRSGRRYVAKGNYNVTRLRYLAKLFPDARFLIPTRHPVWHIASLMKQDRLFVEGQLDNPRALPHLQRAGHFEFGLDRRPINTGDDQTVAEILDLWRQGNRTGELRGWARYWAMIHHHLADVFESDPALRQAGMLVSYEEICQSPRDTIAAILDHCGLDGDDGFIDILAAGFHFPNYYQPQFNAEELAAIAEETGEAAARFGYNSMTRLG